MDLPEGWRALRKIRFENADEVEILTCLDLMKEMAETLEYYARDPHIEEGHICDPSPYKAQTVLEKFREWK